MRKGKRSSQGAGFGKRRRRGERLVRLCRPLHCEVLEDRRMLAGVTLITHGFQFLTTYPGWLDTMGHEIANQAGTLGEDVTWYQMEVYDLPIGSATLDKKDENYPNASDVATGEIIVTLDWSDVANHILTPSVQTQDIANAVLPLLTAAIPEIGIDHPLVELPIHLIGHSRGGAVVSALAARLGEIGIVVDQLTTLDPHPLTFPDLGVFPGPAVPPQTFPAPPDSPMQVTENVVFADNYWRADGLSLQLGDFDGERVPEAYNVELNEDKLELGGYDDQVGEHADVHLWYHGTIGSDDDFPTTDNSGGEIPADWYSPSAYLAVDGGLPTGRDDTGFGLSRIGGYTRPSAGLVSFLGGSGSRDPIPSPTPEWANIGYFTLSNLERSRGDSLSIGFHSDVPSSNTASISFFLDDNQNPYDNPGVELSGTITANSGTHSTFDTSIPEDDSLAGTRYVVGKITVNENGKSRYFYGSEPLTISGQFQYSLASYTTANSYLSQLDTADLNGDGYTDIVAQLHEGWQALYNQAGAGFTSGPYHGITGYPPNDIVSFDKNGDLRSDLVFSSGNRIYAFSSVAGDTWANGAYREDSSGRTFGNLAVADFNDDGRDDLVATLGTGIQLFYGQASGLTNLAWGPFTDAGSSLGRIAVGDINGDGLPDIAAINGSSISTFLNDSAGGLTHGIDIDLGTPVQLADVQVADLNGDGFADVVTSYKQEVEIPDQLGSIFVIHSDLYVLFADGFGGLSGLQTYSWIEGYEGLFDQYPDYFPVANIAIGRLNEDALPDIAITTESQNGIIESRLKVLHQMHGGSFGNEKDIPLGGAGHTYGMAITDFNSDMANDLAVAEWGIGASDRIYVLYGTMPQVNSLPVAIAGGPYTMSEGANIALIANGSYDIDGTIGSYLWDLDNDGQYDDASGVAVNFSRANDGIYTVRLKVIDNDGGENIDTAVVTVTNVAPTANAGGPYNLTLGASVLLDATGSFDPGNDIVSYHWDLDNDGQFDDATGSSLLFTPSTSGTFFVRVEVADDDGATDVDSATVDVTTVGTPGDFDIDGDVDGRDFLAWQRGYGTIYDSRHLADWQANYGAGPLVPITASDDTVSAVHSGTVIDSVLVDVSANWWIDAKSTIPSPRHVLFPTSKGRSHDSARDQFFTRLAESPLPVHRRDVDGSHPWRERIYWQCRESEIDDWQSESDKNILALDLQRRAVSGV